MNLRFLYPICRGEPHAQRSTVRYWKFAAIHAVTQKGLRMQSVGHIDAVPGIGLHGDIHDGTFSLISPESNNGNVLSLPSAAAERVGSDEVCNSGLSFRFVSLRKRERVTTQPLRDNVFKCRSSHVVGPVKINP